MFGLKKIKQRLRDIENHIEYEKVLKQKPDLKIGEDIYYMDYDVYDNKTHSYIPTQYYAGKLLELYIYMEKCKYGNHYYWKGRAYKDEIVAEYRANNLTHTKAKEPKSK